MASQDPIIHFEGETVEFGIDNGTVYGFHILSAQFEDQFPFCLRDRVLAFFETKKADLPFRSITVVMFCNIV